MTLEISDYTAPSGAVMLHHHAVVLSLLSYCVLCYIVHLVMLQGFVHVMEFLSVHRHVLVLRHCLYPCSVVCFVTL